MFVTAKIHDITEQGAQVIFAGESTPTLKRYKRLDSYSPSLNDRVLMVRISGTYVILGKIE